MSRYDGLIPFQPGESGNPNGRPAGTRNRSTIIKELLAIADKEGVSNEYKMNMALLTKALEGELGHIKEIQDTVYGKMADKQELTGKDGSAIETRVLPDTNQFLTSVAGGGKNAPSKESSENKPILSDDGDSEQKGHESPVVAG